MRTSVATLIVVGNRGLGTPEGEALGSVPAEIVKNAICDVTVIQTGADREAGLEARMRRSGSRAASRVGR